MSSDTSPPAKKRGMTFMKSAKSTLSPDASSPEQQNRRRFGNSSPDAVAKAPSHLKKWKSEASEKTLRGMDDDIARAERQLAAISRGEEPEALPCAVKKDKWGGFRAFGKSLGSEMAAIKKAEQEKWDETIAAALALAEKEREEVVVDLFDDLAEEVAEEVVEEIAEETRINAELLEEARCAPVALLRKACGLVRASRSPHVCVCVVYPPQARTRVADGRRGRGGGSRDRGSSSRGRGGCSCSRSGGGGEREARARARGT